MSDRVDIDGNLYAVTWRVTRGNLGPCAAATVLLAATDVGAAFIEAPLAFAVLRALILIIVGYAAYRMLLTGGAVCGWRAASTPDGRIPWRYAGIMVIILGPILLLGVVWSAPGSSMGPTGLAETVLGVGMVVTYATLYILFGTALPEVAERGSVALRDAFDRGRSHYRRIGRALALGPWVFRAAAMLVIMLFSLAGFEVDPISAQGRAFQPAGLAPLLAFKGTHVFAEVMTAVVLTRAYRRYRAVPDGAVPA